MRPEPPEIHPDRQAMLADVDAADASPPNIQTNNRRPRSKPTPFRSEHAQAVRTKEQRQRKQMEIAEAQQQRRLKQEERQKLRRSIEKARRPDRKGQRRLGRESKLLPKMVENLFEKLERQKRQHEDG